MPPLKTTKASKKIRKSEGGEEPASAEAASADVSALPTVVEEPIAAEVKDVPMEKPVEKEGKVAEKPAEAEKPEEPKVEEKPKDVEEDAPADKRKRIVENVAFSSSDATLNVLVSDDGVLSTFQQGGFGLVLGAARANTAVKAGRYYYEVKVVDLVREANGKYDLRVGFSTSAPTLLGGEAGSLIFDIQSGAFHNGETTTSFGKRGRATDVVGILLNREAKSPQNNTISLFINGERKTEPQKFSEDMGPLFPHVIFKGCSVTTNFRKTMKKLEFTVRMIGDAAAPDVEKSTVVPITEPEVVFPIGFDVNDYIKEFAAAHPNYTVITSETMRAWAERSGQKTVPCCEDGGKHIGNLMRNRKYIIKMSDTNFPQERKNLCARFACSKKIAHVMLSETNTHVNAYDKVTLPTEDEGFDEIKYIKPKAECEQALEAWKADCKLRSRVDDLKVGTLFKEKMAEFKKIMDEKKKDKESYAEFQDEDYMLVTLRAEVHYLLHAFKADVNDDNRLGFATDHFAHYFKLYTHRGFDMGTFRFGKVADMLELISDVLEINEKKLMLPVLDKDADPITFFEFAETARKDRQDRLDAGDENSALKFSAKQQRLHKPVGPAHPFTKGGGKGQQYQSRPQQLASHQMRAIPGTVKRVAAGTWEQQSYVKRMR
eukprot:GEMP01017792.1.p1 GENE.GEMP01017792.1~~GEMP01017792.1.p1  ORF type:complete len:658 (+),score=204.29 GEMP01017792.1:92-2065(+)